MIETKEEFYFWLDHSDCSMNSKWYSSIIGISEDDIILCTDNNSNNRYCLTEDAWYHLYGNDREIIVIKLYLNKVKTVQYTNNNIIVNTIDGKKYSYAIGCLAVTSGNYAINTKIADAIVKVLGDKIS